MGPVSEPSRFRPPVDWPGVAALVLGLALGSFVCVRLAQEDDLLFSRDAQVLLLFAVAGGLVLAAVLGLLGFGLRLLTGRDRAEWRPEYYPAHLVYFLARTLFFALITVSVYAVATERRLFF
jgi:hypothetical protein